jgi:phage gp29-like protein
MPQNTDNQPDVGKMSLDELTKTLGNPGTKRYSGYFYTDYDQAWNRRERAGIIEEMRRGDADVKAALKALKVPLLSAQWRIVPKDETEKAKEVALEVERQLFGMEREWPEFLREALAFLDFGHYAFEKIWRIVDGTVELADLSPRTPRSIQAWRLADGRKGIQQVIENDDVKGTNILETPLEKLLLLTNEREGDDLIGQSVMRAAFKHWDIKNMLYKIQAISCERFGVGIPVAKMGAQMGEEEKAETAKVLKGLRSSEKGYVIQTQAIEELRIMTPEGNPQADMIQAAIDHHGRKIYSSVLATFMDLGGGKTGSFALSKDQSSFFENALKDVARYVAGRITRDVIRDIVRFRFGEGAPCPKLDFGRLGDFDWQEMSAALSDLTSAGLLDATPEVKRHVRDTFGLPAMTDEELEAERDKSVADDVDAATKPVGEEPV